MLGIVIGRGAVALGKAERLLGPEFVERADQDEDAADQDPKSDGAADDEPPGPRLCGGLMRLASRMLLMRQAGAATAKAKRDGPGRRRGRLLGLLGQYLRVWLSHFGRRLSVGLLGPRLRAWLSHFGGRLNVGLCGRRAGGRRAAGGAK